VQARQQEGRPRANRALLICACVTPEDAPKWLIYDTDDGDIAWSRVSGRGEVADLVDAKLIAVGHADPSEVLRWLQGETPDPWGGGSGGGDESVVHELGHKIRRS
jgi:hypothetical protein